MSVHAPFRAYVPVGPQPLLNWGAIGSSFVVTTNSLSHPSGANEGAYSLGKFLSGTSFEVWWTAPDPDNSSRIGVAPGATLPTGDNDLTVSMFASWSSNYGHFVAHDSSGNFYAENNDNIVGTKVGKIVGNGTQITLWVSFDGGTTFRRMQDSGGVDIAPFTQAAVDYYVKIWADGTPQEVNNILVLPAI